MLRRRQVEEKQASCYPRLCQRSCGMVSLAVAALVGMGTAPAIAQGAIALARNFRPDPMQLQGTASGSVPLGQLAGIEGNCKGFANASPNHTLELTSNFPLVDILVLANDLQADTSLLVKSSNGLTLCADDEYRGRSPHLSRRLPQGTYQVWVGTSAANRAVPYTLSISEIRQK